MEHAYFPLFLGVTSCSVCLKVCTVHVNPLMGDGRGSQGCSVGRNSGVCHFLLAFFSLSSFPYLRLQVPDSKNSPGSCSCYYTAPDYFSGSPTCKLVPKHPWCVKHWAVFVPVWVESVNPCPKDIEILRSETGME